MQIDDLIHSFTANLHNQIPSLMPAAAVMLFSPALQAPWAHIFHLRCYRMILFHASSV
ncbi:hypothetical protein ASPWEDRAFT_518355 [Aspergillus wentii DTO 134E9]|uniref:Uncharacterized protein n=1 Tax=Aspergillus wentii DTO 134E9 TaxID=1073089 RepID=A0A1L9RL36_ASPWE|nr:uncharacterized protein ASPWEDRAFT_518355 [Aspergillus wentii DTO 134E9]OJJ35631.1 hypothetical protein ASPWEDRAFT_518355 [Aspergillus wentii DTO 134E9]